MVRDVTVLDESNIITRGLKVNAEQQRIHERLKAAKLPHGWTCEEAWPWRNGTHLIAPRRAGGVVVKDRTVHVQLPGNHLGPCSPKVDIGELHGKEWLKRMVDAAVQAAHRYAKQFR